MLQKEPVAVIGQNVRNGFHRHEHGRVISFRWRVKLYGRSGKIYRAQLFRPHLVFGHIGEAAKCTQTPRSVDGPAGFLVNFAMKRSQRAFTRINSAAGQLEFRHRLRLMGQQYAPHLFDYCVDSRTKLILPVYLGTVTEPAYQNEPFCVNLSIGNETGMPLLDEQGNPNMTEETIAWDDTVLPFQLDATDTRGRVARLDGVLDGILKQHNYPPSIEALVAEMALLTALIGQTIKLRWKLSLQVRNNGPARLIATDYYAPTEEGAPARIRAYASFDSERVDPEGLPFDQVGSGYFAVLIDQGEGNKPYQGITPLSEGSLSKCAEAYFAQSEQLPTRFSLTYGKSTVKGGAERWRAGGVMLQHMPKASPFASGEGGSGAEGVLQAADLVDGDEGENWNRVNILLNSVEEFELIGPSVTPSGLLLRLFHEEAPRVFDAQPVEFGCLCSEERVRHSLSMYSAKDITHMTTDEGLVTADCQFCGAHYELDAKTVGFDAETEVPSDG